MESGERAAIVREKQRFWTDRGVQGVPAMIFERRHLATGARGEAAYAETLRRLAAVKAA